MMASARILAGAAVLAAACALPSAAQAQIGPCPTLMPPPCIVIDPSKIAQSASEIANKTKQIAELKKQADSLTSIQGVLGKLKSPGMGGYNAMAPLAPLNPTTIAAASTDIDRNMPPVGGSPDQQRAIIERNRIMVRSAAGDGYALSLAMKQRLSQLNADAQQLKLDAAAKGTDIRTDWQINSRARNLMMRALMNLREIQAARINLEGVSQLGKAEVVGAVRPYQRPEVAAPVATNTTTWGKQLGDIANLTNKLQSLQTAKQLSSSYKDSIAGFQQTQAEYQSMLQAANQSQARLQNLANSDAYRKRVSAATLMNRANQIMAARDQTTWDNPDKAKIAKSAADYAEDQLDKLVSGDVSNSWSDYLRDRAEAYKQEAFFRPINEDAKALEADARRSVAEFEQSVGFGISDEAALDRQITEVNAQLKTLGSSLDGAPQDVRAQRDAIFANTMRGANYDGGTPNMGTVDLGNVEVDPRQYGYEQL